MAYYGIPSSAVTRNEAGVQNFDFTPSLISMKAYEFGPQFIRKWVEHDVVAEFLAKSLHAEACRDWFDIVNIKTGDIHPDWHDWKIDLKKMGFFRSFMGAFQSMKTYGIGVMNYTRAKKFQLIEGDLISDIELDIYGEPERFKIQTRSGLKEYNAKKFDVLYQSPSYLQPVFDILVYMKWITYSLTEAAAREGSKFTVVWTRAQDEALQNEIRTKLVGMSSRKLAVASHAVLEDIDVIDTKTNADIVKFLEPLYQFISLKCRVPSAMLMGLHLGPDKGSVTTIGGMYEAYAIVQNEVEDIIVPLLEKYLNTSLKGYRLEWKKAYRQSQDEIEAVLKMKAERHAIEMGWKKINEIRHEEGLEEVPGGDVIVGFPGSTNPRAVTDNGEREPKIEGTGREEDGPESELA